MRKLLGAPPSWYRRAMCVGTKPFRGIPHLMGMAVWFEEGGPEPTSGTFANSIFNFGLSSVPAMIRLCGVGERCNPRLGDCWMGEE